MKTITVIQIWIHIEAIKLLIKGVEFIPHPEGAETKASMLIASALSPYFALQEWFESRRGNKSELKDKSD